MTELRRLTQFPTWYTVISEIDQSIDSAKKRLGFSILCRLRSIDVSIIGEIDRSTSQKPPLLILICRALTPAIDRYINVRRARPINSIGNPVNRRCDRLCRGNRSIPGMSLLCEIDKSIGQNSSLRVSASAIPNRL